MRNEMEIVFDAVSDNEGFARVAVAAFVTHLNPTLEEVADIKTAVSEAVTNSIIHGYENWKGNQDKRADEEVAEKGEMLRREEREKLQQKIWLRCVLEGEILHIEISDKGKGIEDVQQAMEPLFTTKPQLERSGMGFAFMEAFMDELEVESVLGQGTTVRMSKKIGLGSWIEGEE